MKTTFIVTAQTAQKDWSRTVETREQADALAAEWTSQYRAQCTVILRETGFMVGGGKFDTTKTVSRTETADAARARQVRNIKRCLPEVTDAQLDHLLLCARVIEGDFDRRTLEMLLRA